MAEATQYVVTRERVVREKEPRYVLDLTRDEAVLLLDVTNNIGGHAEHSRRQYAASIGSALSRVLGEVPQAVDLSGGIFCHDREELKQQGGS